jgi:DNA-binding response OmpR family regulator
MRMAVLGEQGGGADRQAEALEARGHVVCRYRQERELLRDVVRESFDVLLVDDTLFGLRGRSLVLRLKGFPRFDGAVVFVNCGRDELRLAEALAAGADDFVASDVGVRELEARLRAILRRRVLRLHTLPSGLQFGPYSFDPDGRHVQLDGQPIALTNKEYELALFLFANEGRLVSRGHLLDIVWRRRASAESRTLDSHVSRVRRNLLLDRRRGFELVAVYGSGYRLDRCPGAALEALPARPGGRSPVLPCDRVTA